MMCCFPAEFEFADVDRPWRKWNMIIMGASGIGVGFKHFVIGLEGRRFGLSLRLNSVFLLDPPLNNTWLLDALISVCITIIVSWLNIVIEAELA
jgi:hypothetical protein